MNLMIPRKEETAVCFNCGRTFHPCDGDDYTFENEQGVLCEDCFNDLFTYCGQCHELVPYYEYVLISNKRLINNAFYGTHMCVHCAKENELFIDDADLLLSKETHARYTKSIAEIPHESMGEE